MAIHCSVVRDMDDRNWGHCRPRILWSFMSRTVEPSPHDTIWKLGMTKGALVAFTIIVIAIGIGFVKQRDTTIKAQRAAEQAQLANRRLVQVVHQNRRLAKAGIIAAHALCAEQASIRASVRSSVQYLIGLERGTRQLIPGVSKQDILLQVSRQQAVLQAFDDLRC
jgi:predicted membrane-bound mannosyltransferase